MPYRPRGEERADRKGDPDKRLAFVLLRYFMYWDQGDLSREAGISQGQISLYDQGRRTVPDAVLERTAKAAGFPLLLLPFLLRAIRGFRLLAEGRWKLPRVLGGDLATGLLGLGQSVAEIVAGPVLPQENAPLSREEERVEAWLEGLVAAGMGQSAEAEAKLQQVRGAMAKREIAFDYALATLDLAVVLLSENRTEEVRAFATDLLWIFRNQQMSENALAALRLFAAAVRRETATVGLARRIRRFLNRAQKDSELKLEETGAGQ